MVNNFQSKSFLIVIAVLILIVLIYFFGLRNSGTQVLTPDGYASSTKVLTFEDVPPNFPAEIILENRTLNDSVTVTPARGAVQSKVSYKSDNNVANLLKLYQETLTTKGWQVLVNVDSPKVAVLTVSKGGDIVLITIATLNLEGVSEETGSLITFQYDK